MYVVRSLIPFNSLIKIVQGIFHDIFSKFDGIHDDDDRWCGLAFFHGE